jgi:predicted transcriptional regulator of viral defense system
VQLGKGEEDTYLHIFHDVSTAELAIGPHQGEMHDSPRKLGDYAMTGPYKEAARRQYETAQAQDWFFTTKQAARSGFAEKTRAYHVKVGNWIREHRGIYRMADFSTAERPADLMLWYLWSQNRQEVPEGACSHNTALSPHELSDIMPSNLHVTVPTSQNGLLQTSRRQTNIHD